MSGCVWKWTGKNSKGLVENTGDGRLYVSLSRNKAVKFLEF